MHCLPPHVTSEILEIVGPRNLMEGENVATIDHGVTPENLGAGIVVLPSTTEEVAAIVKCCHANGVSLVPHGGRTGLVGGAVSKRGELALSTARLNRILHICPVERVAVVEAGVTLHALQEATATHCLETGIDLPSRGSATIGGMTSTNAGGVAAFRFGVMRHRILGLEAVLADGSIYSDLTRVVKNVAGYDLKHLFIGSEGTLGIVTRVAVKLEPEPAATATALFGLPTVDAALETVRHALDAEYGHLRAAEAIWKTYFHLTSSHHRWAADEYNRDHPVNLLITLGGSDEGTLQSELARIYEDLVASHPDISAVIALSRAQDAELWRLREDTDLIYRKYPGAPSYDVSIPLSQTASYLDRCLAELKAIAPALDPFVFGHIADGNLHIVFDTAASDVTTETIQQIETILYKGIHSNGGSFSAEHGIGTKRIRSLEENSSGAKLSLMRQVKKGFDPEGILNPGKVLDSRFLSSL